MDAMTDFVFQESARIDTCDYELSGHARTRMQARRLPQTAIEAVLRYGRVSYARGAEIHALGRKEVEQWRQSGLDLRAYENIQVVCAHNGTVMTVYRNQDFRSLREKRPKRNGFHRPATA